MAGLPCQPQPAPEDSERILDEVLRDSADADSESCKYHAFRDCLRAELKSFAKKYHFEDLRGELAQACEKLRCDLLKDLKSNSRLSAAPQDLALMPALSSENSDGQGSAGLEGFLSARERLSVQPRLNRQLTWSGWMKGHEDVQETSPAKSRVTFATGMATLAEDDSGCESRGSEPHEGCSSMASLGKYNSSRCSTTTDDREDLSPAQPRKIKRLHKSLSKGKVFFHHYVTSRWTQRVSQVVASHRLSDSSEMSVSRTDRLKEKFVKCCHFLEQYLDYPIALAISLNGIFLGVQAQYQSVKKTEKLPAVFPICEIVFCFVFLSECVIRLTISGSNFFRPPQIWWNAFDTGLVGMQLTEVVGMLATSHEFSEAQSSTNFSFLRLVRVLRLFRVLRLVRLLHFITELNVIISSIANSVRSLFWTMFLLLLMIYMVGITFTQVVLSHRMTISAAEVDENDALMEYWWGTVLRSMLSLYQAILGGVDWDTLVSPLMVRVSVLLGPVFVLYIAFALLAMMNVITGIFVESALKNAAKDKDNDFVRATKELFADGTVDEAGVVKQEDFELKMGCEELQAFVRQVGIEPKDARLMFRLIDSDCTGSLYLDQLLSGMLRLRSGVKVLDLAVMMHEHKSKIIDFEYTCLHQFEVLEKSFMEMRDHGKSMDRVLASISNCFGKDQVLGREQAVARDQVPEDFQEKDLC